MFLFGLCIIKCAFTSERVLALNTTAASSPPRTHPPTHQTKNTHTHTHTSPNGKTNDTTMR